jgi:hypothetical protein
MEVSILRGSRSVSKNIPLFAMSEPKPDISDAGIYLGRTTIYNMPFMLDEKQLLNPHIAVVGMTGSGKSYLLKSIIIRAGVLLGKRIIILDWNGEYSAIIKLVGGTVAFPNKPQTWKKDGSVSFDLSKLSMEEAKLDVSNSILSGIESEMRHKRIKPDGEAGTLIVVDEAWKILAGRNISSFYREGRKYGFAIITATQLLGDISNEIIANSACVCFFKIQNGADYRSLLEMGIAGESETTKLSTLNIGNCMVIVSPKKTSGAKQRFFIRRIDGPEQNIYTIWWKEMKITIPKDRFLESATDLLEAKTIIHLSSFVEGNGGRIDLIPLIKMLAKQGTDRTTIIIYLKKLGCSDFEIVNAYDEATCKLVGESKT